MKFKRTFGKPSRRCFNGHFNCTKIFVTLCSVEPLVRPHIRGSNVKFKLYHTGLHSPLMFVPQNPQHLSVRSAPSRAAESATRLARPLADAAHLLRVRLPRRARTRRLLLLVRAMPTRGQWRRQSQHERQLVPVQRRAGRWRPAAGTEVLAGCEAMVEAGFSQYRRLCF